MQTCGARQEVPPDSDTHTYIRSLFLMELCQAATPDTHTHTCVRMRRLTGACEEDAPDTYTKTHADLG